uniref:Uncharacterized protein n=1 Tax=Theropithecus gelada TaxID=9565 RepID=A0A8D2F6W1_THEGE
MRPGQATSSASTGCVPSRRQAEPEQSDGEEDFYYTELDVGVDTLTDGLSSLTPVSPTASMPPAFPRLELPELLEPPALPSPLRPTALPLPPPPPPVLSAVANPQSCHSDRVYQGCLTPARLEPQPTEVGACPPALSSRTGVSLRCVWAEGLRPPPAGEGPRLTAPHALCPPPQEAPRRCKEVPESVWHGAPGPVVHSLPLEEGLPAVPGLSPAHSRS